MNDPLSSTPIAERTTAAVLQRSVDLSPDKAALIDENGGSLTYAEVQEQAYRIANGLSNLGMARQEQVAVMLDNHTDNILLWLGATVGGRVEVPINTAFKGEMLRYVLEYSGARMLVIEGGWIDRLAAVIEGAKDLEIVAVRGQANAELPARIQVVGWSELISTDASPPEPPAPWDLSTMLFTSGTEGNSKGVLCSHAHSFTMASYPPLESSDEVVIVTLPLFHAAGLWAGVYNALRVGGTAVIHGTFSASRFWEQVRNHGGTTTVLLGAMADFLRRQTPTPQDRDHTLKFAAVIPSPPDAAGLSERFGIEIGSAYGLTEAGTILVSEPGATRPLGCGSPRPHIEAKVVDEHDIEVKRGEVGELVVRSREPWSSMLGYHRMPEATTHAWRNLWLHTGDAVYQDDDGQYVFVDRRKDALRRRGENVSSFEVERHLLVRDDIAEAAVVAVASEHTEDELKAALVLAPDATFDPAAILRDLYERMPYFMVPRYLEVVDTLPMTPTHKVKKTELRSSGVTDATWDCEAAGFRITRDALVEPED